MTTHPRRQQSQQSPLSALQIANTDGHNNVRPIADSDTIKKLPGFYLPSTELKYFIVSATENMFQTTCINTSLCKSTIL